MPSRCRISRSIFGRHEKRKFSLRNKRYRASKNEIRIFNVSLRQMFQSMHDVRYLRNDICDVKSPLSKSRCFFAFLEMEWVSTTVTAHKPTIETWIRNTTYDFVVLAVTDAILRELRVLDSTPKRRVRCTNLLNKKRYIFDLTSRFLSR